MQAAMLTPEVRRMMVVIISLSIFLISCGSGSEKEMQDGYAGTGIDTLSNKTSTGAAKDSLKNQSQNNRKESVLIFADSLHEYKEMFKCFYENVSISKNCYYKNSINFDSLIRSLCKFVPYSLLISAGGKLKDGRETSVYYFKCCDSANYLSSFILILRDTLYCDTILKFFFSSNDIPDSVWISYRTKFNRESLISKGVSYVLVMLADNLSFNSELISDIEFDISVKDTINIQYIHIDLENDRGIICHDSNIAVHDYRGFVTITNTCYFKYPYYCLGT